MGLDKTHSENGTQQMGSSNDCIETFRFQICSFNNRFQILPLHAMTSLRKWVHFAPKM